MPKTIDRLFLFIKELGLSARQFDISIGTANGYTLRMLKNNASVGSDVIEKIVSTYPQINLVWLITGKGDMFIDQKKIEEKEEVDLKALERMIEQKIELKLGLMDDIKKEVKKTNKKK